MKPSPLHTTLHLIAFAMMQISALHADEPQDLTKLRETYDQAVEQAMNPLQLKYIAALEKLKVRYTKEGVLEAALAVDAEIKKQRADVTAKENAKLVWDAKHLMGTWMCNDNPHDQYHIWSQNNAAQHASDHGKWEEDGKLLRIRWDNGFRLEIELNQTDDTIVGKSYAPGVSNFQSLKLTRMSQEQVNKANEEMRARFAPTAPDPFAPQAGAVRVEGEQLKSLRLRGGILQQQPMAAFGNKWSNASQLYWVPEKTGDELKLAIPVHEAGTYRITARFTMAPDYGTFDLYLNDKNVIKSLDLYLARVDVSNVDLGSLDLRKGDQELKVVVTGANDLAIKRYMFGLDCIELTKQ